MERAARLPDVFVQRLLEQLGPDDAARALRGFEAPRARAVRANRLRTTRAELRAELEEEGLAPEPAPAPYADALLLPPDALRAVQATAAAREGRLYLQGLASQAAVIALDPRPGEHVLDLCAAPGSKTSQIAARLGGTGRLVANDRSRKRGYKLRAVLESQGALDGVELVTGRGEDLARREPGAFDRVLVDAPCSGEGRFRVDDEATFAEWSRAKVKRLAAEQRRLLLAAAVALRPGGTLVYSTCTLAPAENEQVLGKVLRRLDGALALEELPATFPGERPGLTEWRGRRLDPSLSRARRLLPDERQEGFFVARLVRRA